MRISDRQCLGSVNIYATWVDEGILLIVGDLQIRLSKAAVRILIAKLQCILEEAP